MIRRVLYLVTSLGAGVIGAAGLLLVWLIAGLTDQGLCENLNDGRAAFSAPQLVPLGKTCTYTKGPVAVIDHTSWALTPLQLMPIALGVVATICLWRAIAPGRWQRWVHQQGRAARLGLLVVGWFATAILAVVLGAIVLAFVTRLSG